MLLKTIFIAIFVAVYCDFMSNSKIMAFFKSTTTVFTTSISVKRSNDVDVEQKETKKKKESESGINRFKECADDREFQKEINNAQDKIVVLIVTAQSNNKINIQLKKHFFRNNKIQVNLDTRRDCHRTTEYLGVNTDVTTSVRMMKKNVLVPNVIVVPSLVHGKLRTEPLDDAFSRANEMPTEGKTTISQDIANWFTVPTHPMLRTGPHPATRGLPQVMPSNLEVIPEGQSAGSSMTDSQRAVWTPVFQRPVQRVDSSLPQASASGSSAQLPQGQQRVVTASFRQEPQAIVPSDWLNLTMGSSASGPSVPGSNATTSGQQSKRTASALRPVSTIQKQHGGSQGGGKSKGPK